MFATAPHMFGTASQDFYLCHNRVFRGGHIFVFPTTVPFASPWEIFVAVGTSTRAGRQLANTLFRLPPPPPLRPTTLGGEARTAGLAGSTIANLSRSGLPLPTLTVGLDHLVDCRP